MFLLDLQQLTFTEVQDAGAKVQDVWVDVGGSMALWLPLDASGGSIPTDVSWLTSGNGTGWILKTATGTSNWLTCGSWILLTCYGNLWILGSNKNLDLLTCYNSVEQGFRGTIPLGTRSVDFVETILRKILSSRAKMKMMKLPNFHGKSSGIGLSGIGIRTGLGTRRITRGRRTLTRKNAKVGSRIGGWNGNIGGGGPRCEDHVLVVRRPAGLAENGWVLGARSKFAYQPFLFLFGVVAIVSIYPAWVLWF